GKARSRKVPWPLVLGPLQTGGGLEDIAILVTYPDFSQFAAIVVRMCFQARRPHPNGVFTWSFGSRGRWPQSLRPRRCALVAPLRPSWSRTEGSRPAVFFLAGRSSAMVQTLAS